MRQAPCIQMWSAFGDWMMACDGGCELEGWVTVIDKVVFVIAKKQLRASTNACFERFVQRETLRVFFIVDNRGLRN